MPAKTAAQIERDIAARLLSIRQEEKQLVAAAFALKGRKRTTRPRKVKPS